MINKIPVSMVNPLNRSNVGLGNVDNTSDADKPVSTLQQSAIGQKVSSSALIAGTGSGLVGFISGAVGGVVRTILDKLREVSSPEDFGCVGDYYLSDGSVNPTPTDDSVNFQKALTALKVGQKIRLNRHYYLGGNNVTLTTRLVTLEGPGGLVGGTLIVGNITSKIDYFINIVGVTFSGGEGIAAGAGTRDGISLRLARRVRIDKCRFINLNKGVAVPIFTNQQFHGTGMIRVTDNEFANVNYGWYNEHDDTTDAWMYTNDCSFNRNTLNISYITGVWSKGIDGFHVTDNVFFNYSYSASDVALKNKKEYNIYIGHSDWIHVTGNNCFESGLEAIWLDQSKHFTVANNLIAWCGQKDLASGIKISGVISSIYGTVTNNNISRFTKHAIEILTNLDTTNYSNITVMGNNLEYSASTSTYYGTTAIGSISHYAIYQPLNSPTTVEAYGNSIAGVESNFIQGSPSSGLRMTYSSRIEGYRAAVLVTAANTPVAILANRDIAETSSYSAMLTVIVRQGSTQAGNLASYILHVTKAPTVATISQISAQGLIAGSAANWPSFTFTFDGASNELRATPVSNTSGTFYFDITTVGSIRAFKP